ncbi:MAG: BrnA antitoxin family protein [Thermoleophilia bacterium]
MKAEYDFSKGKRGARISSKGKTRITIYIDNDVLDEFRSRAEHAGIGYQTMMNEALKESLGMRDPVITESLLRKVIREELPAHGSTKRSRERNKKRRAS